MPDEAEGATTPLITPRERAVVVAQGRALGLLVMLLERDGHLREGDFAGHLALLAVVGREDELQSPETFTANDVMASRASTCREIGEAARGRATREDEG